MTKFTIAVLCIAGLCGVARLVVAQNPEEPIYQGKRLSEWLRQIEVTDAGGVLRPEARMAIRAMGTNALPHLLRILESEKDFSLTWGLGVYGIDALGEAAAPAVPRLILLLESPSTAAQAEFALPRIGTPAVPLLV